MMRTRTCGFCMEYCGNAWCVSNNVKGEYVEYDVDRVYFDDEWGMSPYGENKVLFLAEYLALKNYPVEWRNRANSCIKSYIDSEGRWITRGEGHLSHDNFTAIVCLSVKYGFDYHKDLLRTDLIHCMLHPRDALFYISKSERWFSFIGKLLYFIPLLAQIHSCASDWKERNKVKVLKTDGKLLTWLRCRTFKLPVTSFICTFIINRNMEFGSWKKCFEIYFKNPMHPNRVLEEEKYNV